jgi:predicted dehydrogenase
VPPIRLLQVGLGPHGRGWARNVLPNNPDFQGVAYVDKDPYALDALREETRVPADRCFESLREAIAETQPDAVLNTTALPAHLPVTQAALEAGLHVLVEKPFAPSLVEAQRLVEEARVRNVVLMVSQNYRFFPAPRAIAAMVHESALGRLYEVAIDFRRYSTAGPNGRGRHHLEQQPLLVDMSIHHFDLLRLILSREPQRIYCEAWNPEWTSFSGPSVAVASIVFEGGVVVSYRGSWISASQITPWAGEWHMEFEHGEVTWLSAADSDPSQDRVVVKARTAEPRTIALPQVSHTGTSGTLAEFAMAIQTGREPETSGRHNLGTIALMEAAVESATSRQAVTIHRSGEAIVI